MNMEVACESWTHTAGGFLFTIGSRKLQPAGTTVWISASTAASPTMRPPWRSGPLEVAPRRWRRSGPTAVMTAMLIRFFGTRSCVVDSCTVYRGHADRAECLELIPLGHVLCHVFVHSNCLQASCSACSLPMPAQHDVVVKGVLLVLTSTCIAHVVEGVEAKHCTNTAPPVRSTVHSGSTQP